MINKKGSGKSESLRGGTAFLRLPALRWRAVHSRPERIDYAMMHSSSNADGLPGLEEAPSGGVCLPVRISTDR
jgi:hypothetical protein